MIRHLELKAYGKINLGLDVVRRREDGYHEVRMIMQTVRVYDAIELNRTEEEGIRLSTNLYYLPDNENNLGYRAAKLLMDEFGIRDGVEIKMKKFIPVAAGMAGGSSDAAAVLFGVNKMFGLGLSKQELMERGVRLGADVPYCIIDELPANRQPIKNCVVNREFRPNAYRFIENEVRAGRQAYVICPMVEPSEMLEAENVIDYTEELRRALSPSIRVEYLHGKMKGKEKNAIMEAFAANEIHVLVSTTVIEVGINVPNATVMMIENAERFGLAQLHQLRGRVGRGKDQSYCIMVNASGEEDAGKRLDILNKSNDGFYIASEDLKLRGPGDLFGVRQSGDLEFHLADIFADADILKAVSDEVKKLMDKDPLLEAEENQELKRKMNGYLERGWEKVNL